MGIPDNRANDYVLGVEVMSKGQKRDFTAAQKASLAALIHACAAATAFEWEPLWLKNRPQHKDWTDRKIDTRYTNEEIKGWIK